MEPGQTCKGQDKETEKGTGNRGGGDLIKAKASRKEPRSLDHVTAGAQPQPTDLLLRSSG